MAAPFFNDYDQALNALGEHGHDGVITVRQVGQLLLVEFNGWNMVPVLLVLDGGAQAGQPEALHQENQNNHRPRVHPGNMWPMPNANNLLGENLNNRRNRPANANNLIGQNLNRPANANILRGQNTNNRRNRPANANTNNRRNRLAPSNSYNNSNNGRGVVLPPATVQNQQQPVHQPQAAGIVDKSNRW